MTSAKSSKLFSLIALALLGSSSYALAQDAGYTPPPMFEDMTPPMVRPESKDGYLTPQLSSPNTPLPPAEAPTQVRPIVAPRVSIDPNSPRAAAPAPVPAQPSAPVTTTTTVPVQPSIAPAAPIQPPKMMQPIIEQEKPRAKPPVAKPRAPAVTVPKVEAPKAPAPVPPLKPEIQAEQPKIEKPVVPVAPASAEDKKEAQTPTSSPKAKEDDRTVRVKRDPKESAIQGPKTMPALPTETIDSQPTFETKPVDQEKTILQRHQEEVKKETEKAEPIAPVAVPKPNVAPAAFDKGAQGALKKSIEFQQGQIGLSSAEIDPIAAAVNKELDAEGKKDWRVQIRAYATPYGTGVSSDRRIALSRALSLRTALIAQGVPAARIDVLAEGGAPEGGKPDDRIDVYMYGPATE